MPFLEAFDALNSARQFALGMSGMVPQQLSLSEIFAYADRYGWGESLEVTEDFRYVIQFVDGVWMSLRLKQIEKEQKR